MRLIGIDGAKRRHWVLAISDSSGEPVRFELTADLSDIFRTPERGEALIVIDVPIGILSGAASIKGRSCDKQARMAIGRYRACSVFTPPCREVFGSTTQREASEGNRAVCNRGLTYQAFGILNRIEAVDKLMTPAVQEEVREGHPEVTFARLKGNFVDSRKKTREGESERLHLLATAGITFNVDEERQRLGRGCVGRDDLIDAAAMLVTAERILRGLVERLGR